MMFSWIIKKASEASHVAWTTYSNALNYLVNVDKSPKINTSPSSTAMAIATTGPNNVRLEQTETLEVKTDDLYQWIKQYAQTLETTCLRQLEAMLAPEVYRSIIAIEGFQDATYRYPNPQLMRQQEPAIFYYQHTINTLRAFQTLLDALSTLHGLSMKMYTGGVFTRTWNASDLYNKFSDFLKVYAKFYSAMLLWQDVAKEVSAISWQASLQTPALEVFLKHNPFLLLIKSFQQIECRNKPLAGFEKILQAFCVFVEGHRPPEVAARMQASSQAALKIVASIHKFARSAGATWNILTLLNEMYPQVFRLLRHLPQNLAAIHTTMNQYMTITQGQINAILKTWCLSLARLETRGFLRDSYLIHYTLPPIRYVPYAINIEQMSIARMMHWFYAWVYLYGSTFQAEDRFPFTNLILQAVSAPPTSSITEIIEARPVNATDTLRQQFTEQQKQHLETQRMQQQQQQQRFEAIQAILRHRASGLCVVFWPDCAPPRPDFYLADVLYVYQNKEGRMMGARVTKEASLSEKILTGLSDAQQGSLKTQLDSASTTTATTITPTPDIMKAIYDACGDQCEMYYLSKKEKMIQMLDQRIQLLTKEAESSIMWTNQKLHKKALLQLLKQVVEGESNHVSLFDGEQVMATLKQRKPDISPKYLLTGRTGKLFQEIRYLSATREDEERCVTHQITTLENKKQNLWFFVTYRTRCLTERIQALQALKALIAQPGYGVEDALDKLLLTQLSAYQCLNSNEKALLAELRKIEVDLPKAAIGQRVNDSSSAQLMDEVYVSECSRLLEERRQAIRNQKDDLTSQVTFFGLWTTYRIRQLNKKEESLKFFKEILEQKKIFSTLDQALDYMHVAHPEIYSAIRREEALIDAMQAFSIPTVNSCCVSVV